MWNRVLCLALSLIILLPPFRVLAAVDSETTTNPLVSGMPVTGNGAAAGGLESFKTDLFTGSAGFSVPIEVPPGTGGMAPKLALNYSSAKGNSWVGFGWSLDLGSIRRDTRRGVPSYVDASDRFVMGDDRLVKDTAGDYHTANESFVRIRHLGSGSSDHWEAETKEGMRLYFGLDPGNRIANPNQSNKIFEWKLDRIEDRYGNFLLASYHSAGDTGVLYLKNVIYTRHASAPGGSDDGTLTTKRRVDFCLEGDQQCDHVAPFSARPDTIVSYLGGFQQETTRRLGRIRVALADAQGNVTPDPNGLVANGVRWYDLGYQQGVSRRTRLYRVTPQNAGRTAALPAKTFTYQEPTAEFGGERTWTDPSVQKNLRPLRPSGQADFAVLDMNGDGLPDRVVRRPNDDGHWDVYLNKGDGTGFKANSPTCPLCSQWTNPSGISDAGIHTFMRDLAGEGIESDLIDMNGDGLLDRVVKKKNNRDSAHPDNTWWHVYLNDYPNSSGFRSTPIDWENPSGDNDPDRRVIRNVFVNSPWPWAWIESDVIDFDGDGLPDRLTSGSGSDWFLYKNNGSGFDAKVPITKPSGSYSDLSYVDSGKTFRDMIDMNGDGLPDVVEGPASKQTGYLYVFFGTGKGFSTISYWPNPSDPVTSGGDHFFAVRDASTGQTIADIVDINGDGLPDRVTRNDAGTWLVYYNYGKGFANGVSWTNPSGSGTYNLKEVKRIGSGVVHADVQDFDGDGLPDRPYDNTNGTDWSVYFNNTDPSGDFLTSHAPDLLTRVDNGFGGSIEIAYQSSAKYLDANGNPASPSLPFPVQTVRSMTYRDGLGNPPSGTTYSYAGGYYEGATREFLGFGEVRTTAPNGTLTLSAFHQTDALKGSQKSTEVWGLVGAALKRFVKSEYDYAWRRADGSTQVVRADGSGTPLPPGDPTIAAFNTWAARYSGATDANRAYLALPIRTTRTSYNLGNQSITKQVRTENSFDSYGNEVQRREYGDLADAGDDQFVFTEYATPLSASSFLRGLPSRTYATDGGGSYAARLSEALSFYDGRTDSSTDKGSLTQTRTYVKSPLAAGSTYVFTNYERDGYGNVLTMVLDPGGLNRKSRVVFDTPTRTFPVSSTAGADTPLALTQTTTYDPTGVPPGEGRPATRSDPNGAVTTYAYDTFGRPTSVTGPGGLSQASRSYAFATLQPDGSINVPARITTTVLEKGTAASPLASITSVEYVDGLGRSIRTAIENHAGAWNTRDTFFNVMGQVSQTTLPFTAADSSLSATPRSTSRLSATSAYDAVGRTTDVVRPGDQPSSAVTAHADYLLENVDGMGGVDWGLRSVSTTLRHRPLAFSERPR